MSQVCETVVVKRDGVDVIINKSDLSKEQPKKAPKKRVVKAK